MTKNKIYYILELENKLVKQQRTCASFIDHTYSLLSHHKMSSGQNTMRTPTLQPVPESLPADHVSNSNKKKVRNDRNYDY